jgi:hypothetical protein
MGSPSLFSSFSVSSSLLTSFVNTMPYKFFDFVIAGRLHNSKRIKAD